MTGPVPVLRPHASQAFDDDLDADRPMDQDELLDFADQGPLPSPTLTAVPGPLAQFLSDMPDFMEGIEESLQGSLDSLPVPTSRPGPSPDGISIHEAIQVSSVNCTSQI